MSDWKLEDFSIPEVEGSDRFHDFALPLPLMHAVADLGYEYCTPIQSNALPWALSDYDVTGQAQTGTGGGRADSEVAPGPTLALTLALIREELSAPS